MLPLGPAATAAAATAAKEKEALGEEKEEEGEAEGVGGEPEGEGGEAEVVVLAVVAVREAATGRAATRAAVDHRTRAWLLVPFDF